MARPTDYTPELLEKAKQYKTIWKDLGDAVPSVVGLCVYLEISKAIAYVWIKDEDKKEFLDILDEIATNQERELINGSIKGQFNSTISKLMMTKHGYSDKQETDVTSGGEKLTVQLVNFNADDKDTP
jgi:hypothetical protein